jgi:hypothetical protein
VLDEDFEAIQQNYLPINQLTITLYLSPMSSSFYIFDSHEHNVSEFPHTIDQIDK